MKAKTKEISIGDTVRPVLILIHLGSGPNGKNIGISGEFIVKKIIPDDDGDGNLLVLKSLRNLPPGEITDYECFFIKCEV